MDGSDSSDPERDEYECEEAIMFVKMARAQSAVQCLEKELAAAQVQESTIRLSFFKCRSREMERRSELAHTKLGALRNSIWTSGSSLYKTSLPKHRCQDSIESIPAGTNKSMYVFSTPDISFAHQFTLKISTSPPWYNWTSILFSFTSKYCPLVSESVLPVCNPIVL